MPKCQALHIVRSYLCFFYLNGVIFAVLDVSSLPLKNVKLLWKFFYINIFGFISMDKFLYETRVLDNSYLRFKVQITTSDSTEITAGGITVRLEGPVLLDAALRKNRFVLNASSSSSFRDIMGSKNYIRGPCTSWTPLAEKIYPNRVFHNI